VKSPLVTIVTPSYNQGHFIRATIESVLSQDYPNVEYIVMDGGSTDNTAAVVNEYRSRLTFISEKDRGQTHAINKGFQQAKGSIVAWLNSDDTYLPGAIRHGVEGCAANPTAGAIYGEGFQIDYDGNIRQRFPYTEPFNLWKLTHVLDYILQQSVFFRRECVEAVGWADESLHFGMDWDLLVRLGKRYGLAYVPESFGCLREYGEAKSFAGGAKRFAELAKLLQKQTGEKRPPGWWFYGLDTYDKIWSERISRFIPGPLGAYIARRFVHVCRAKIDDIYFRSQGLYADQWAATRLNWMLPEFAKAAVIEGCLPGWARPLDDQQLRIFVNGRLVSVEQPALGGDFRISVPLQVGRACVIRIDAEKYVVPEEQGLGPDRRRLAWQMKAIEPVA
jgi:glycosyltransferase involved in cell wall biosynthesis